MPRPEHHVDAIGLDLDDLSADQEIGYLRDVIVPLVERLGYDLAQRPELSVAPSVFVMALDIDKRFRWFDTTAQAALMTGAVPDLR